MSRARAHPQVAQTHRELDELVLTFDPQPRHAHQKLRSWGYFNRQYCVAAIRDPSGHSRYCRKNPNPKPKKHFSPTDCNTKITCRKTGQPLTWNRVQSKSYYFIFSSRGLLIFVNKINLKDWEIPLKRGLYSQRDVSLTCMLLCLCSFWLADVVWCGMM